MITPDSSTTVPSNQRRVNRRALDVVIGDAGRHLLEFGRRVVVSSLRSRVEVAG